MYFSIVTALYPIREGYLQDLRTRFSELLTLLPNIRLFVWTDREWTIQDERIVWMKFPLSSFKSYIQGTQMPLILPKHRDAKKDTQNFMALMNTKIEMLWRALPFLENTEEQALMWVDAGITKIFKNHTYIQSQFETFQKAFLTDKILIPGCWKFGRTVSRDDVHWRFCGGIILVPVQCLTVFQTLSEKWLKQICEEEKRAVWEVNVWAEMEQEVPNLFRWYEADHNDSILAAPVKIEDK